MVVPMALFIFPALFVVILGPAVIQIISGFGK
jgi:pilus assembly protein TadC